MKYKMRKKRVSDWFNVQQKEHRKRKQHGLLFRFGILFAFIIILSVVMNYICTNSLSKSYVLQEKQNYIKSILDLVSHTMEGFGENTLVWAEYCEKNGADMDIQYENEEEGYEFERDIKNQKNKDEMEAVTESWIHYFNYVVNTYDLKYLYFVRVSSPNDIVYIADGKPDDKDRDGKIYRFTGDIDHYEEDLSASNPVIWKLWNSGDKADIVCELSDTEYGYTYRLWCPVVIDNKVAGLLGANIDVSEVAAEIHKSTFPIAVWSCLFFSVLLTGILFFLKKTIVDKIILLDLDLIHYSETKEVSIAEKIRQTKYPENEIGDLSQNFAEMILSLDTYMKKLNQVTAEKERIGAELDVARNIQASMLPCTFPAFPERSEFEIHAAMFPAKEVGGDFYDFFLVDDNHLALVMADVSGKGVPAALFMVISRTLIKNCAQTGMSPGEILQKVNNQLCENNDARMFVTVWIGLMEISTGVIRCANAGHEHPVLKQNGHFDILQASHGFVMGAMENMLYEEYKIELEPGGQMFLYTDGLPEALNREQEFFGMGRMAGTLNACGTCTTRELLEKMKQTVDEFYRGAEQFDDITMLSIEYKGKFFA